MRPITQEEAEKMRDALKAIAGFRNPAARQDGGQAAARLAHETLDALGLFLEDQAAAGASGDQEGEPV